MLKKVRITVSLLLFGFITLYFLDFAGKLPQGFHFLAKIQFIPALLSLNLLILAGLFILTFVFGRVYCSSICPLGIYQDIVGWFSKKMNRRKKYTFSNEKKILRWTVVALSLISFLFGFTFLFGLVDPYGIYGRIATHIFRPVYLAGNNLFETIFTSFDNHTFYKVCIYVLSVSALVISLAMLLIIGFLAWKNGRTYCNTICPVGTVLGYISKFSLFRVQFDKEHCTTCGVCAKKCKSSCIDYNAMTVDYSRCVNCFNCITACKFSSMKYAPYKLKSASSSTPDESKRRFLSALVVVSGAAATLTAQKATKLFRKKDVRRKTPIVPPGSLSIKNLQQKCISCHLCVSKCPSHVIKPAYNEYGAAGFMQPVLYFDKGFCNYDCTVCGEVCPTGSITALTKEEKHHTQMGKVVFVHDNCIVPNYESNCGACSEHCPTQAVYMVPYKDDLTIPATNTEICVGCGGCEYVCPAKPYKAIYVEGLAQHNKITIHKEEKEEIKIDDFGF